MYIFYTEVVLRIKSILWILAILRGMYGVMGTILAPHQKMRLRTVTMKKVNSPQEGKDNPVPNCTRRTSPV